MESQLWFCAGATRATSVTQACNCVCRSSGKAAKALAMLATRNPIKFFSQFVIICLYIVVMFENIQMCMKQADISL